MQIIAYTNKQKKQRKNMKLNIKYKTKYKIYNQKVRAVDLFQNSSDDIT